jgi:hypothetical protein
MNGKLNVFLLLHSLICFLGVLLYLPTIDQELEVKFANFKSASLNNVAGNTLARNNYPSTYTNSVEFNLLVWKEARNIGKIINATFFNVNSNQKYEVDNWPNIDPKERALYQEQLDALR